MGKDRVTNRISSSSRSRSYTPQLVNTGRALLSTGSPLVVGTVVTTVSTPSASQKSSCRSSRKTAAADGRGLARPADETLSQWRNPHPRWEQQTYPELLRSSPMLQATSQGGARTPCQASRPSPSQRERIKLTEIPPQGSWSYSRDSSKNCCSTACSRAQSAAAAGGGAAELRPLSQ